MSEEVRHFSLRKLSVGLASVLVGVSIFGTSQAVKADTVTNNQTSSVTNNAQSSDTQKNGNVAKSSFSNDNQVDNAKNNLIQTQVEGKKDQIDSLNQNSTNSQEVNHSNDLQEKSAEKNIVSTSSLQESNNQSNTVTKKTVQHDTLESGQKAQSFNLPKNSQKFNRKVLAANLSETPSSPTTNGGFDEATWGKLDVNNWQGSVQDGMYQLTGYTGDLSHVIVPNEADFEKAGKSTNGLQVGITRDTINSLISRTFQDQTIAFSKTSGQKVKAIGTDWSNAFSAGDKRSYLNNFDGSNLDISNVTNMARMFENDSISDLTSLTNWDTSKVSDMSGMFSGDYTRDLTPLANWDVSNVTNMSDMFSDNDSISNLTPLANWDVSNVTNMSSMFASDYSISDLIPLTHWNVSNVTNMSHMFDSNSLKDLKPLANWNTGKVTDMSHMFDNASVGDLSPLANWDTSNVTNMSHMFDSTIFGAGINKISDLTPLANWNVNKVTDMSYMFSGNTVSNLTSLANWNVSNVANMSSMFEGNKISDLTPLANWNINKVRNMGQMFEDNSLDDLRPLANWNTGQVVNMGEMFERNLISDLTPLANWNVSQVVNMSEMFKRNSISDLTPLVNWNISKVTDMSYMFANNSNIIDLTNINNVSLMQGFLKTPRTLSGTTFITNNADLVKVVVGQELPVVTNTATRTIVFHFPDGTSKTVTQHIYYKTIAPVEIEWSASTGGGDAEMIMMAAVSNPVQSAGPRIIKTYTIEDVKASDWQLDTSKQNDAIIVNGQVRFASVKIPHINGYKAYIVPNKLNSALFTVSFMAVPTENKPSTPVEKAPSTPSKPTTPTDNSSNSAWSGLDHKVVDALNQSDSGWTLPADNSTYKAEVPVNAATIDLSNLVIAQPVHAQTRTQIRVNKHFKLRKHGKKHAVKHVKHRKNVARQFKKYRL